jgi:hypothetical protein
MSSGTDLLSAPCQHGAATCSWTRYVIYEVCTNARRRVVSGLTVRNTALHVSPCLAYLVSTLSSSRGNEGMRNAFATAVVIPNRPQPCKFLRCLLLARRSNDVLVKSQESRVKNIRCLYWLFWHPDGGDVDIRPFGKRDSFFLELPFFVFLNGFGGGPQTGVSTCPRAHVPTLLGFQQPRRRSNSEHARQRASAATFATAGRECERYSTAVIRS